eukprot:26083_1
MASDMDQYDAQALFHDVDRDDDGCCTSLLGIIIQITITIMSFIASLSIIDGFRAIIDLDTNSRGYIAIIASSLDLVLVFIKLCYRMAKSKNPGVMITSFKSVFVGLVDTAFDIFAAIALINSSLFVGTSSSNDAMNLFIIIGTFFGTTGEVIELIIEILFTISECFTRVAIQIMFIQLTIALMELAFGIYVAIQIMSDESLTIVALSVYSVLTMTVCCGCVAAKLIVKQFAEQKALQNRSKSIFSLPSPLV